MSSLDAIVRQTTVWRWGDWQASWPLPVIFLIGLTLVAIGLALASYLWQPPPRWGRAMTLALFRVVSLLMILLMVGGLSRLRFESERSDLVVLVDNSLSMAAPQDNLPLDEFLQATAGPSAMPSRWEILQDVLTRDPHRLPRLAERYRLRFRFLESPEDRFDAEKKTAAARPPNTTTAPEPNAGYDIQAISTWLPQAESSPLGDVLERTLLLQRGRSTAAVVLLSDGIVNAGSTLGEAATLAEQEQVPLVTVGLGSDAPPVDVAIDEVLADTSALLGDRVDVRAIVRLAGTQSNVTEVRLVDERNEEVLDRQTLSGSDEERFEAVRLSFLAQETRDYDLAVVAEPVEGERDLENNRRGFTVAVRNEPLRVLLVQDKPSYEFRFLKHLLERTTSRSNSSSSRSNASSAAAGAATKQFIELTTVLQSGDPDYADQDRSAVRLPPVGRDRLSALDVVILGDASVDLLGSVFLEQLATAVRESGLGLVIIAGPEHFPGELAETALAPLLPIRADSVAVPRLPVTEPSQMRLTELGRQTPALRLQEVGEPPLPVLFGLWKTTTLRPAARVLMEGFSPAASQTTHPLLVSQLVGAGQVWVQLTDQMYRLQPYDGTGDLYRRYWLQLIRQLARGKRRSRQTTAFVDVMGDRFSDGVEIPVRVRLGGAGEGAEEFPKQVSLDVRGTDQAQSVALPATGSGVYRGTIPPRPSGAYRVVLIDPVWSDQPATDRFTVAATPQEWSRLRSELDSLRQIAQASGGQYLSGAEAIERLEEVLPPAEAVRRRPLPPQSLWNHPLTVAWLVGLLCGEWILRRRWGHA